MNQELNQRFPSFDSLNREVITILHGNELTIKVSPQEGGINTVTFTFQRDFFGIVFYSKEYQRNKQKLIYDPCYPKISNND
jgi:hypothetical protein